MANRELTEEQREAAAARLEETKKKRAAKRARSAAATERAAARRKAAEEAAEAEENIFAENNTEEDEIFPEDNAENVESAANSGEASMIEMLKAQNELLQKQMEEMQRQFLAMQRPQVIQMAAETERVYFLWQADVADYNTVTFGPGGMYGSITGKTGTFSVPKNELSRILDNRTRSFIERRWLIVLDGLTDEERESMGVAYRDGEILDRKVFDKMVDLSLDEIREIYPKLCDSHKEIVARHFYEAWLNRSANVTREKVIALRDMTRDMGLDVQAFQTILKEMNISEEE